MCGIHHTDFAVEEPVAPPPPPPPQVPPPVPPSVPPQAPKPVVIAEEIPSPPVVIVEEVIPPSFHALAHAEIRVEPVSQILALILLFISILLAPLFPSSPQPKRDEL